MTTNVVRSRVVFSRRLTETLVEIPILDQPTQRVRDRSNIANRDK
jgi:hypothetical protein